MSGKLYIVATPIGNLEDITLRALRVLKEVDLVAAEDTRRTRKLLTHYQIRTPLTSFFEHNEVRRTGEVIDRIKNGAGVALVSAAGTPAISDPGFVLVRAAIEAGIEVVTVPGPSAVTAGLAAAGLPTDCFFFDGFLPRRSARRRRRLEELKYLDATLVFYESPYRLMESLQDMLEVLGDRRAALLHELTKVHEEVARGRLSEIITQWKSREVKGEFTVAVAGAEDKT